MTDVSEAQTDSYPKRLWYRTTLAQAAITGGVAFTAPGMWNALNTLGAAGAAEPYLLNAANSLVFGFMGFLEILGGAVIAKVGLKRTLVLGSIGWPLYSASLYTNNRYGNEWFVLVGATTCGLSAGLFWASEGAIILGYPEPSKRGKYLSIWVAFRNAGPIVGGIINLALNYHRKTAGKVGYETYYAMIAIMCLGLPISLLSPPEKVQRSDGTKVKVAAARSWGQEVKAVGRLLLTKRILLMLPIYFSSYFYWGYQSTFTTLYFTVRARALSSLVTQLSGILASVLVGLLVDRQSISKRNRARWVFVVSSALCVTTWIWAFIIQDIYAKTGPPKLDWTHKNWARSYFLVFMWSFSGQSLQNYLYWLMASFTDDITQLGRYSGILRGVESLGQCVAFGVNASHTSHWVSIGLNFTFLVVSLPPAWLVIRRVGLSDSAGDSVYGSESLGESIEDGKLERKSASTIS